MAIERGFRAKLRYRANEFIGGGAGKQLFFLAVLTAGLVLGFTVIGGMVYRGSAIPALRGAYIYSDLARWVRTFRYIDGAAKDRREWPTLERGSAILSFGVDLNSEILAVTSNGVVLRLVPG